MILKHTSGKEIHLKETNDIKSLENQLMLLGINGLFYSEVANDIRKKINQLRKESDGK